MRLIKSLILCLVAVSVVAAPIIMQQPQGTTNHTGSNVVLSVTANGNLPLFYQWYLQFPTNVSRVSWRLQTNLGLLTTNFYPSFNLLIGATNPSYPVVYPATYAVTVSDDTGTNVSQSVPVILTNDPPRSTINLRWQTNENATSYTVLASTNLFNWFKYGEYSTNQILVPTTNAPAMFFKAFVNVVTVYNAPTSVTLAWNASIDSTVIGYYLYMGPESMTYTNKLDCGAFLTGRFDNLVNGFTYYFAATAYDTNGLESIPSNEVSYSVPLTYAQTNSTMVPIAIW